MKQGAALAVGVVTLARIGFADLHVDEDACVAIGWLLSRGAKLYSDVFSHHMPLDYVGSWAVAALWGPSPAACRAFMIALWAVFCAGLYAASRWDRREAAAAILFTLLCGQWMTYWMGQLMLVENYWGYAVVLLLALAQRPPSRAQAFASGVLLALLACASLTCAPAALLLLAAHLRDARRRKAWPALAAGACAWMLLFGAWCLRHADLSLWFDDAVRFNASAYAYFNGLSVGAPASGFLRQALAREAAYFAETLRWDGLEAYFQGLLRLAALGWVLREALARRFLSAAWRALLILSLRLRAERFPYSPPYHSAPFFLAAAWLLAREAVLLRAALKRDALWAAACAAILLPTLVPTSLATGWLASRSRPSAGRAWLSRTIQATTGPEDAIGVMPMYPWLYVDSRRAPATPSVFYLPWQAAWPPQREATLRALRAAPPKLLVLIDSSVWDVPWKEFGADIIDWARSRYLPASAPEDPLPGAELLVRRDYAGEFLRRCPGCFLRAPALPGPTTSPSRARSSRRAGRTPPGPSGSPPPATSPRGP